MVARLNSSSITGLEAQTIEVEVHTRMGQGSYTIIGLGDSAVKEARDRVKQAIRHLGFEFPNVVLVNLAPAEIKKEGSSFDLAIAVGILLASGQLRAKNLKDIFFFGELALDARVKTVKGVLALVISAKQAGAGRVIVPAENYLEARLVKGIEIIPISSLASLVKYLTTGEVEEFQEGEYVLPRITALSGSIDDVRGQEKAKRALVIAASGGHNLLMIGPPGCGKSMLAARFPGLLPRLSEAQSLEVVKIHSVCGQAINTFLNGERPFRAPHHAVSDAGLLGGGSFPKPGEISLAHNGVLFLDEFPEFRRSALESLRAPLENGSVQITRAKASYNFPANFQLIAAMNPCPCGRLGAANMSCSCGPVAIKNYLKKLSEPILDRIDLHCELDAVAFTEIAEFKPKRQHDDLQERVKQAQLLQFRTRGKLNRDLQLKDLNDLLKVTAEATALIEKTAKHVALSARSIIRVLRVAQTIADLEGSEILEAKHAAEALSYRKLERLRRYIS